MNKLKELWRKNKVLIVLGIILIVCMIAILSVTISFFLGGSKSSYGDRLTDIKKHPITEKFKKSYIANLSADEKVKNAKLNLVGRIIYVEIDFVGGTQISDAESKAASTIESFGQDILTYYDINFILRCEKTENSEGFIILGARNIAGTGLVWNNNTPVESDEE